MSKTINKNSRYYLDNPHLGAAIAMRHNLLRQSGYGDDTTAAMQLPAVGVFNFHGTNPCNGHHRHLAEEVAAPVLRDLGIVPIPQAFACPNDAVITGGELVMAWSQPMRDMMAMSMQAVAMMHWHDGLIIVTGCDKSEPAAAIALGLLRNVLPGVLVYGGSISQGCCSDGTSCTIADAVNSFGAVAAGKMSEDGPGGRQDIIAHACDTPGGCGVMATSVTEACINAALGFQVINSASNIAVSDAKNEDVRDAARYLQNLMEQGIVTADIVTRDSFLNAITVLHMMGGSTNGVQHLIAKARCFGIKLAVADFAELQNIPVIANISPGGVYTAQEFYEKVPGGLASVFKYLIQTGHMKGEPLTYAGVSMEETVADAPDLDFNAQDVILPIEKPLSQTAALRYVREDAASRVPSGYASLVEPGDSAVFKINSVHDVVSFRGPAQTFPNRQAFLDAVTAGTVRDGSVIVVRNLGPGSPEELGLTAALTGSGLSKTTAIALPERLSGVSQGIIAVHFKKGPSLKVQDGDMIVMDGGSGLFFVEVPESEFTARTPFKEEPLPPEYTTGLMSLEDRRKPLGQGGGYF